MPVSTSFFWLSVSSTTTITSSSRPVCGVHPGVGDRDARSGDAVDDAAQEEEDERAGQSRQQAADGGAGQRQDEDGLAPDPVRKTPPDRREHELGDRERGEQGPDGGSAGVE